MDILTKYETDLLQSIREFFSHNPTQEEIESLQAILGFKDLPATEIYETPMNASKKDIKLARDLNNRLYQLFWDSSNPKTFQNSWIDTTIIKYSGSILGMIGSNTLKDWISDTENKLNILINS